MSLVSRCSEATRCRPATRDLRRASVCRWPHPSQHTWPSLAQHCPHLCVTVPSSHASAIYRSSSHTPPCGRHRLLTIYLVQRAVQHRDHRVLSWLARSRDPRARRFVAACRHEVEHYHCRTGRLARTGYAAALLFRFRLLSSLRLSLAADITSLVVATIKHPTAFRTAVRIGGFIVLPRLAVLAAVKKAFARPVRNAWTKQSFVRTRRGASRQQAEGTVTALVCADRKYPGLHLRFDHL